MTTPRTLPRWLLLSALVLLGLAGTLALTRQPTPPQVLPVATSTVTVGLPERIAAGSSATVTAGPFDRRATQATIAVTTTYASWSTEVPVRGRHVEVALPGRLLARTGVLDVLVRTPTEQGWATSEVTPLAPAGPLELRVGARSITADAAHWAMGVVIPEDRLGNPIAEGTPVDVVVLHPDGTQETLASRIDGGLAWLRVWSRTVAGRARLAVLVQGVRGGEADLEEVPGPPVAVGLVTDPLPRVADGRDLVAVRTTRLLDAFGNEVADGTAVELAVATADGLRQMVSPTVNGVAEFVVEAPATPQTLTATATAYGAVSEPLDLAFATDIAEPIALEVVLERDRVLARVGPVVGRLGQLAPDGTPVTVTFTSDAAATRTVTGQLRDGRVEIALPRPTGLTRATVTVEVSGATARREVRP